MYQYEDFFELVFDNLRKIAFPEEWLAVEREMSKHELLLVMLVDKNGEMTMSMLSDQMNIPMSTATGVIDRLVKKGYVQRDRSETDRRIVAIMLTEQGKAFTREIKSLIGENLKRVFEALDEEEKQYLFKIFTKVAAAFQNLGPLGNKEMNDQNQVRKIEIE